MLCCIMLKFGFHIATNVGFQNSSVLAVQWCSSSFVYHRLILSTLCVGAMLWPMAQLRRNQLRMVVDVVGSYWWCGQLSVLARHTHMLHCPPVPTSSWMLCTDRPQFAFFLGSSSVFDSDLPPWRLLLGPICGDVLVWVHMLPTPASTLPWIMLWKVDTRSMQLIIYYYYQGKWIFFSLVAHEDSVSTRTANNYAY